MRLLSQYIAIFATKTVNVNVETVQRLAPDITTNSILVWAIVLFRRFRQLPIPKPLDSHLQFRSIDVVHAGPERQHQLRVTSTAGLITLIN